MIFLFGRQWDIFACCHRSVSPDKGSHYAKPFQLFLHTKISHSASSSCYKVGTQMGRLYRLCVLLEDLNLLCASQERPPCYVFLFYPFLPLQIIEYSFFIKGLNEWSSYQNVWQRNKGIQISVSPDKENYYAKTGFFKEISPCASSSCYNVGTQMGW